jgi:hypothetical protein
VIKLFPQILFGIMYFMDIVHCFMLKIKLLLQGSIGPDPDAKNEVNTYTLVPSRHS